MKKKKKRVNKYIPKRLSVEEEKNKEKEPCKVEFIQSCVGFIPCQICL